MNIVIVGGGKVGTALCSTLSREDHNIALIEIDPVQLQVLSDRFELLGVLGNGSFYDVQKEAHVDSADIFIAVTPDDEVNIIASVIAKKLGAQRTIARVRTPEYASHIGFVRDNLGISRMINPELEAAREIDRLLQFPAALSVEPFGNNRVNMLELPIEESSFLSSMNMIAFRQKYPGLICCAVQRDNATIIPEGTTNLQARDHLFVTGVPEELNRLYKSITTLQRVRSVLIIGGGRITNYLLRMMQHSTKHIKVIEEKAYIATSLASNFPNVTVIQGDGTDQAMLEEENISGYDSFITLTGIDEENVILSMFAHAKGVPQTVTKINRTTILPILKDVGLQSVITPAQIMATAIVRIVRSLQNSAGSNVEALFRMPQGDAEILQFFVRSNARIIQKPIASLSINPDTLIALILRENRLIFPTGRDTIQSGDHVLVVTKNREYDDIDDILSENA